MGTRSDSLLAPKRVQSYSTVRPEIDDQFSLWFLLQWHQKTRWVFHWILWCHWSKTHKENWSSISSLKETTVQFDTTRMASCPSLDDVVHLLRSEENSIINRLPKLYIALFFWTEQIVLSSFQRHNMKCHQLQLPYTHTFYLGKSH